MEKKKKMMILEARARFEKSLASPDLTSEESIKSVVGNQLLRSTFSGSQAELENIVQRRALEVSNFLEMLRSASGSERSSAESHGSFNFDWKLKQESDQLRVMYREGPQGTPFHTLLAEGFVDGPVDSGLCVSWESTLYKNWWPQYNIPTFKIISSYSLQKVRVGEEISLVRVKPPWPVTEREAILHNFEVEFFKEELVVVLLNTVPSTEHFDMSTHGFSKAGIPDAKDTVRIDIVGGFAIQKVSRSRSYFRATANMDIKLDFVPPTLINFIARQLIGNGHKLYQKAVASVVAGNKHYAGALNEPMYTRIRDHLYSSRKPELSANARDEKFDEPRGNEIEDGTPQVNAVASVSTMEIEEERRYLDRTPSSAGNQHISGTACRADEQDLSRKEVDYVSPEVAHALNILDKAITIIHDLSSSKGSSGVSFREACPESESFGRLPANVVPHFTEEDLQKTSKRDRPDDVEVSQLIPHLSRVGVEYAVNEDSGSDQTALDLLKQYPRTRDNSEGEKHSPTEKQPPVLERMSKVFDEGSVSSNGTHDRRNYGHNRHGLKKQHKRSNIWKNKFFSKWCVSFL